MANNTYMKKVPISLISLCFLFAGICLASTGSIVKSIKIPPKLGNLKEVFDFTNSPAAGKPQNVNNIGKTIIYLQDAHCNYEAQKNMAQLLDSLVKEHKLKLIMVEGGSGNVNLDFLRNYADKKSREEVADKYLKLGKISGEEYLDIISDYPLDLYGIEDEALYNAHLAAFHSVDAVREEGLAYLGELAKVINALKPKIYSEELKYLESAKRNYEDKTLSLGDYCLYMKNIASRKGLNPGSFPFLSSFAELSRLEKGIDFKQAEFERGAFIKQLGGVLNEQQVKTVIEKSQEFKQGSLKPQAYYSFLLELAAKKKMDLSLLYPQLNAYIRYMNENKDINVQALLKEVESIEDQLKGALFANDDQKKLYEISKLVNVLKNVMSLELTPEDYGYFKANRDKFSTGNWLDFLSRNCAKYNLALTPSASGVVDENIAKFDEFYRLGSEREKSFIKNIVNKMNESGEKIAVFIAGGFHTPGMTRFFKDTGYSYAVVTPAITQKTDSSIYLSVLRGERKN